MNRLVILGFLVVGLIGCTSNKHLESVEKEAIQSSKLEYLDKDFPRKPILGEVKYEIMSKVKEKMKDPDSAKFEFTKFSEHPMKGYVDEEGIITEAGWLISFYVNGKNSYGGYAGKQQWLAFFISLPSKTRPKRENVVLFDVSPVGKSKWNIHLIPSSKK